MAELVSDTGALRFRLAVVGREAPRRGPAPEPEPGPAPPGRLLATASLDYLDRRDGERWPLVEVAALYLAPEAARALAAGLADLLQGLAPGFSWQSGEPAALGIQLAASRGEPEGTYLAEIGMDLSGFLAEASGNPPRAGVELALFRFLATRASVVAFASALRAEIEECLST